MERCGEVWCAGVCWWLCCVWLNIYWHCRDQIIDSNQPHLDTHTHSCAVLRAYMIQEERNTSTFYFSWGKNEYVLIGIYNFKLELQLFEGLLAKVGFGCELDLADGHKPQSDLLWHWPPLQWRICACCLFEDGDSVCNNRRQNCSLSILNLKMKIVYNIIHHIITHDSWLKVSTKKQIS